MTSIPSSNKEPNEQNEQNLQYQPQPVQLTQYTTVEVPITNNIPILIRTEQVDISIDKVWNDSYEEIQSINPDSKNWKAQALPLARIKTIMKLDDTIEHELELLKNPTKEKNNQQRFMIAGETPILLSKACELFIKVLTTQAWKFTEQSKRRTLQRSDVCNAICESEIYDFLIDVSPRVVSVPQTNQYHYTPQQNTEKHLIDLQQLQGISETTQNMQWIAEAAAEAVKVTGVDDTAIHEAVASVQAVVDDDVTNAAADVVLEEQNRII